MRAVGLVVFLLVGATTAWGQVSGGTAFAVAPGLLVTNHHAVDNCTTIEVIALDGRRNASIVHSEASVDLALLRVYGLKGTTATLRRPTDIRLGEPVTVFGFPLTGALAPSGNFTNGVVSALQGFRNSANEIQITAPIQPGNSGGPVMDASGAVIGVVEGKLDALHSALATGDIPQNVNFAISPNVLVEFLERNQVPFRTTSRGNIVDTARIAANAQKFTYRIECRQRMQVVKTPVTPNLPSAPKQTTPVPQRESAEPPTGKRFDFLGLIFEETPTGIVASDVYSFDRNYRTTLRSNDEILSCGITGGTVQQGYKRIFTLQDLEHECIRKYTDSVHAFESKPKATKTPLLMFKIRRYGREQYRSIRLGGDR